MNQSTFCFLFKKSIKREKSYFSVFSFSFFAQTFSSSFAVFKPPPSYQMETENLLSRDVEQQQQPEPRRVQFDSEQKDYKYYLIWFWRLCIFAVVGSSSMKVTRLLLTGLTSKRKKKRKQ